MAYYLAHSMGAGERGFAERDRRAARQLRAGGGRAGVARIVYLGGLGEDGADLSHHLASRHEAGAELAAHGVPVTEFRAAVIIGSGSASFEILRHLTERLPVMITPRWVGTRCQPIGIRDVLDYLVGALDHPEATGHRRDRRPRHPVLRRHDAYIRTPARATPADDPRPGAHPAALLLLGEPDLARSGRDRPAADRRSAQRGGRPRSRAGRGIRICVRSPIWRRSGGRWTEPIQTASNRRGSNASRRPTRWIWIGDGRARA